ncbi:MAG: AAA family ATPase [Desulfocucumaceae bacterium]
MRPLKLVMSAFGPFAGTQEVDFRELESRSFFLIHGPTGSGKTTILDAICFSLYGDTSGSQREGRQMRSDHADLSTATDIIFDFGLGSELYRIKRSPDQERPKKKGEGTTVMRAEATLWKRTGLAGDSEEGRVLASGWEKVTEAVERLIGFKSSQFRQVVILPQGEFRRLLTADSKDRQAILETLFRAEFYRRVEESLKTAAKELKDSLLQAAEQKKWVLQEAGADTVEELKERLEKDREEINTISEAAENSKKAVNEAQERLNVGIQASEKLKEKKEAGAAHAELEGRQEEMQAKREGLARARRAAALTDADKSLKTRLKEAEGAGIDLTAKKEELISTRELKGAAEKKLAEEKGKEALRKAADREVSLLEDLTERVSLLSEARRAAAEVEKRHKEALAGRDGAREQLAVIQGEIEIKGSRQGEAVREAATVPALEAASREADQASQRRNNLEVLRMELDGIQKALSGSQRTLQQAETDFAGAREELNNLRELWNRGQASILAGGLTKGTPCPVCGSLDHPSPAAGEGKIPSEEAIKLKVQAQSALELARDAARENLNILVNKNTAIESNIRVLEQELGPRAGVERIILLETAKKVGEDWGRAKTTAEKLPALAAEIQSLKEREKVAQERLGDLEEALQKAVSDLGSHRAVAQERESSIPEGLRAPDALRLTRLKAIEVRDRLAEDFEKARKAAEEAARRLVKCETAVSGALAVYNAASIQAEKEGQFFRARLEEAGFKYREEYEAAIKSGAEIESLERHIKNFDESRGAARERLERAASAAAGLSDPDIDSLAGDFKKTEESRDQLLRTETQLRVRIRHEEGWLEKISGLEKSHKEIEARYSVLGHLSEVANGKNRYGLTFQRFVLGALLDDVLVAATLRLQLMSRGRYHLQRTMDRARSNAAGGLDLEVFDTYTGVARGVSTLSGGETFLASLSLALGLADVVQSYSGGIHLDTIFVDEGFGTLDPESLDFALRALIDLQKGGRLVGIISHVPELRERIDARLELRAGERGSIAGFKLS